MSNYSAIFRGLPLDQKEKAYNYYQNKESFKQAVDKIDPKNYDFINANLQEEPIVNERHIDNLNRRAEAVNPAISERVNRFQRSLRLMFDGLDMKKIEQTKPSDRTEIDQTIYTVRQSLRTLCSEYKHEAEINKDVLEKQNLMDEVIHASQEDLQKMRDDAIYNRAENYHEFAEAIHEDLSHER